MRPSPVRLSDSDLLEAEYVITPADTPSPLPSLGNCFNTGMCTWLCRHQRALQVALGIETVLLLVLLALFRWLNFQMQREELDSDEVGLRLLAGNPPLYVLDCITIQQKQFTAGEGRFPVKVSVGAVLC